MSQHFLDLGASCPPPVLAKPPRLPQGWRLGTHESLGETWHHAIDPDGCIWYPIDGRWTLHVPAFRRSRSLAYEMDDDIAVVATIHGNRDLHITRKGTIRIGTRRIPATKWHH